MVEKIKRSFPLWETIMIFYPRNVYTAVMFSVRSIYSTQFGMCVVCLVSTMIITEIGESPVGQTVEKIISTGG